MTEEKKPTYIFPDFFGKIMSKIDMRTQYEASMMSMTLILLGLMVTTFYMFFYVDFPTWYKVVVIVNLLAGLVFLSSYLVTTFQQYQNYMAVIEFHKQNEEENNGK